MIPWFRPSNTLVDATIALFHKVGALCDAKTHEILHPRSVQDLATKIDLLEKRIMSAISQFAEKQNAFNDRIDKAVEGLTEDVDGLNKLIEQLQSTPGAITPEDQALLDKIEVRSSGIAAKLEALEALTPPVPPSA